MSPYPNLSPYPNPVEPDQVAQVGHGGVAVQDLQDEEAERVGRVEQAVAEDVTGLREEAVDALAAAQAGEGVGLDAGEGRSDDGHAWPPVGWCLFNTTILTGG